jgi:hypothetical protein
VRTLLTRFFTKNLGYDTVADLSPINLIRLVSNVFVVPAKVKKVDFLPDGDSFRVVALRT